MPSTFDRESMALLELGPTTPDSKLECSSQKARCPPPVYRQNQQPWTFSSREMYRAQKSNTLLLEALQRDDVEQVAILLEGIASPDVTYRESHVTACHVAALSDSDALSLLLKAGADGQRTDCFGRRPLHLAAWAGRARHVAVLLNFPLDLQNKVDDMSPETEEEVKSLREMTLQLINLRCEPMEKELVPDMSDIKERNSTVLENVPVFQRGWTALHAACAGARARCVRLLLTAGADARAPDAAGWTPLDVVGCSHYSGHEINVADFSEVIRLLRNAGAELRYIRTNRMNESDTPLHTAVELESLEAIQQLLDAGARVECLNNAGQTPMHVCVKKQLKKHLELLANYEHECANPKVAVDIKDVHGRTVLHSSIKKGWLSGVQVALDAGASVTVQDIWKESPIHAAARLGDIEILQEIITIANDISNIDCSTGSGKTALIIAVEYNRIDCIRLLLNNGASISRTLPDNRNVLHVAAEHGSLGALNLLINHNKDEVGNMINSVSKYKSYRPICFAVLNNHAACVKLLLSKNAALSYDGATTPLHVAAFMNHYEIANIIIEFDKETIHAFNKDGMLPLHEAITKGNRDIITLLLRNGADLCSCTVKGKKIRAIDLIMEYIHKPTEFLEEVFDSYISFEGHNLQDHDCAVKVDYSVLRPKADNTGKIRVIKYLLDTGNRHNQRRLLVHPLINSYLHIKWITMKPLLYYAIALYGVILTMWTGYIIMLFSTLSCEGNVDCKYNEIETADLLEPTMLASYLYVLSLLLTLGYSAIFSVETLVRFGAIVLSALTPTALTWEPELRRVITTGGLLMSWLLMTFLASRFPKYGYYITMFEKVALNVVKILLTFVFVLIGFTVSFVILLQFQHPFDGVIAPFVKIIVMMTSEFEYSNDFDKNTTLRIMFLCFLILCSIVLMNLMVAVAVNDLNNLEKNSNIEILAKRIGFLKCAEWEFHNKFFIKLIPTHFHRYYVMKYKVIFLQRRESICDHKYLSHLREAIFEKAHQNEDKRLAAILKQRLDQMDEVILRQDENESNVNTKLCYDMMIQMNKNIDCVIKQMNK